MATQNVGTTINALKGEEDCCVLNVGQNKALSDLNVSEEVHLRLPWPRASEVRGVLPYMVVSASPIDKLTNDVRGPLDIVTSHFHKDYLRVLPRGARKREGRQLVGTRQAAGRSHAVVRGLILMGGRADEMKSGRKILKDYIDGKLCYCHLHPGSPTWCKGATRPPERETPREGIERGFSGRGGGRASGSAVGAFSELGVKDYNSGGETPTEGDRLQVQEEFPEEESQGGATSSPMVVWIRKGGVIRISSNGVTLTGRRVRAQNSL